VAARCDDLALCPGLEELSREELIALVLQLHESNVALEERVRQLERQALSG